MTSCSLGTYRTGQFLCPLRYPRLGNVDGVAFELRKMQGKALEAESWSRHWKSHRIIRMGRCLNGKYEGGT